MTLNQSMQSRDQCGQTGLAPHSSNGLPFAQRAQAEMRASCRRVPYRTSVGGAGSVADAAFGCRAGRQHVREAYERLGIHQQHFLNCVST